MDLRPLKFSALGVPRNKNLFYVQDKTNRIAYDIIFLTGFLSFMEILKTI